MKKECNIVRDLLPLYLEDMVSGESASFVEAHLDLCAACRAEYENMKDTGNLKPTESVASPTHADEVKPFKTIMKRINLQIHSLAYAIVIFFIFFGFGLTAGSDMMYNSLIMPVVGIFGYVVFDWRAVYKLPVLLLAIDLAAWLFGMVEMDFVSVFLWTFLYSIFVLTGIVIAFLVHFAFRREG